MNRDRIAAIVAREHYHIGADIGEGTHSRVYTAQKFGSDDLLALKVVDLTRVLTESAEKFLPRELEAVRRLRHQNIIPFHGVIRSGSLLCFLTDYAPDTLSARLEREGAFPSPNAAAVFRQVVSAVEYCHKNQLAHRDIKAENVLLDVTNNVKLTDFGMARFVPDDGAALSETFCGTLVYAAPEVLQAKPYNPFKSDVWSLGVLLYLLLCNCYPFSGNSASAQINKQLAKDWTILVPVSTSCEALLVELLNPEAALRPAATTILQHDWLLIDEPLHDAPEKSVLESGSNAGEAEIMPENEEYTHEQVQDPIHSAAVNEVSDQKIASNSDVE